MPWPWAALRGKSLKLHSADCPVALASSKHCRSPRLVVLRELRNTILGLVGDSDETLCAECVATLLRQPVNVVMMTILGLEDRLASSHGVCSTCHRYARVIGRQAPRHT